MSNGQIFLRYDGHELEEHKIDIGVLAPALMAFGDLFKEANRVINGDKTKVKVLVNADIEANCVTLSMDVVQQTVTVWDGIKGLIQEPNVASAKELIEWCLLGSSAVGIPLLGYLKWKGENIGDKTTIEKNENNNQITVNITGNHNNVLISPQVDKLAEDKKVVKAVQKVLEPTAKIRGIENAAFFKDKSKKSINIITKSDAKLILSVEFNEDEQEPQYIVGHIQIYKPELNTQAKKWSFLYNGNQEDIDISETTIAKDMMKRGKIVIGDTYEVGMDIIERKTQNGFKNDFKVVRVIDFKPGKEQTEFDLHDDA